MSRIIVVYGALAGAIIIAAIILSFGLGTGGGRYGELFGYLVMLAALSLIFAGVKRYRDGTLGGVIRFPTAITVGLGIAAVASVVYVAGWEAYLFATDYTFFETYAKGVIDTKRTDGASAGELAKLTGELAAMGENYKQPLYRVPVTFLEILPVGVIVALVSAALLRNSRFLPARGGATESHARTS